MNPILRQLLPLFGAVVSPACLPVDDLSEYSRGAGAATVSADVRPSPAPELPSQLVPTTRSPSEVDSERLPDVGVAPPPAVSPVGPKAATSDGDAGAATADGGGVACSADGEVFEPITGVCYRLSNETASWFGARDACAARGELLVSITSAAEDAFLDQNIDGAFWIGASDRSVEGRFDWVSGELFDFSDFLLGDPDNLFGVQDCVERDSPSGQWQDRACNVQNRFVCEASPSSL